MASEDDPLVCLTALSDLVVHTVLVGARVQVGWITAPAVITVVQNVEARNYPAYFLVF